MTEPDLTEPAWQEWPGVDPPFVQQWNQMALEIHRLKKELAAVRAEGAALVSARPISELPYPPEIAAKVQAESVASAALVSAVQPILSDLVDACYADGSTSSWRLCQVCDTEHRPDEAYPGDRTHREGCAVDAAESLLRTWVARLAGHQ